MNINVDIPDQYVQRNRIKIKAHSSKHRRCLLCLIFGATGGIIVGENYFFLY